MLLVTREAIVLRRNLKRYPKLSLTYLFTQSSCSIVIVIEIKIKKKKTKTKRLRLAFSYTFDSVELFKRK